MGKAKEISLQRRVDWMSDTIDALREQWTNKQLECELLKDKLESAEDVIEDLRQQLDATPDR